MLTSKFEREFNGNGLPFKLGVMDGAQSYVYHWHNFVEILYGLEKQTIVGVGDTHYLLDESDIIIIGQGENHCLFPSDSGAKRLALIFEPSFLFPCSYINVDVFRHAVKHSSDWPEATKTMIRECISTVYSEYYSREEGWQEAVTAELMKITLIAVRYIPKENKEGGNYSSSLKNILEYLSENYLQDITLSSCSEALGYNASYLSSLFKERTGVTFHQYLLNLRLNEAENLLRKGDASIDLICELSGFASVKTFYRVFLRKYGMSPGNYRSCHKDKKASDTREK